MKVVLSPLPIFQSITYPHKSVLRFRAPRLEFIGKCLGFIWRKAEADGFVLFRHRVEASHG